MHGVINLQDTGDRATAAGEYVMGTLNAEDQATFVRALGQDPALRAEVYAWQDRLLALSTRAAPVPPSLELWQRVDSAVSVAAARAARGDRAARGPWWQQLRLWQGVSALAVAASLFMAVLLMIRADEAPPAGARYLAVLQNPDSLATGWVVELQAGGRLRLVPVAPAGVVPAGRALQFWTKPQGAATPTSLGLVRAGQTLELPVARLPGVGPRQLFEITLEPENGSPLGRPTGPILYVGRTVAL